MRGLLMFVCALALVALSASDSYALGRRGMACNNRVATEEEPARAKEKDVSAVKAERTVCPTCTGAPEPVLAQRVRPGVDVAGLIALNERAERAAQADGSMVATK